MTDEQTALVARLRLLMAKVPTTNWRIGDTNTDPDAGVVGEIAILADTPLTRDRICCPLVVLPFDGGSSAGRAIALVNAELIVAMHEALPALLAPAPAPGDAWQDIATAPKSTSEDVPGGKFIRAVYLLGFCPEEGANPLSCIEVIWWEPNEKGGRGCWFGGGFEVTPTRWRPLPKPPEA